MDFLDSVKTKYILCGKTFSTDITYTKMDLIKYFDMENDIDKLALPQMESGSIFIYKNDLTTKLMYEWYDVCFNNYHLIDDSPSVEPNFKEFIENRHDQSVFNLILKKNNIVNYDLSPNFWGLGVGSRDNYIKNALEYPIWTCRNKKGKSLLD